MTLAVFADDTDAPMSSLAAEMTPAGEITTLQTSPVLVVNPMLPGPRRSGNITA